MGVHADELAVARARADGGVVDRGAEHQRDVLAHRAVAARARQLDRRLLRAAGNHFVILVDPLPFM